MLQSKKSNCNYNALGQNAKPALVKTFIILLVLIASACEQGEPTPQKTSISDVMNAISSRSLKEIQNIEYTASGKFIEPHQEGAEMQEYGHVSATYKYTVVSRLTERKLNYQWDQTFIYPFAYEGQSTIIINDKTGSIEGAHGMGSKFFGYDAPAPLYSSRLEAILKTYKLANPVELVQFLHEKGSETLVDAQNRFSLEQGDGLPVIELSIDPSTNLPVNASVLEADFLMGDVLFKVQYDEWEQADDETLYPTRLTYWLGGEQIRSEIITNVVINPYIEAIAVSLTS